MLKKCLLLFLTCLMLLPLAACGDKPKDSDFYTFKRISGSGADRIYVGESSPDLEIATPVINIANEGMNYKCSVVDGVTMSSTIRNLGHFWVTWIGGLELDDPLDKVIPAYADTPGVTVVTQTPTQIVLEKTIDGQRYTATFNGYSDGTISSIILTNEDTCTMRFPDK